MLSSNNKMINIKISKDSYNFIKTLSKKYGVSMSSFCQDCITQTILLHDKKASKSDSVESYYNKLALFINNTYDERRK